MSLLDELELRAQLEARRALGPSAAVAWGRARLTHEPASRARSECLRAVLVEALRVRDVDAVEILVPLLRERPRVDDGALWAACEASPHASVAAVIAEELARCEPSVSGLLVLAALREREARTDEASAAYRRAIAHADGLADPAGGLRARIELARLCALAGRDVEALALAPEIEALRETLARLGRPDDFSPRDALVLARIELAASGRYQRVRALDRLLEIVAQGGAIARAALRLLARHLERTGSSLTAVEADRIVALLARARGASLPPDAIAALERRLAMATAPPAEREAAVVRTAGQDARWLLERARAVRDGGTAGPAPSTPERRAPWLALLVITQIRARRLGEALAALRELVALEPAADALGWTMLARAASERVLRGEVLLLAHRWLTSADVVAPARGYLDLAARFERAGLAELAGLALSRARAAHEPDARPVAIQHAIRRAWALRDRGEIHEAHRVLDAALRDALNGSGTPASRAS